MLRPATDWSLEILCVELNLPLSDLGSSDWTWVSLGGM
jgi:hypothetical protein